MRRVVARGLPEADAAGIDVNESGARVVADSAGLLRQRGAAKLREAPSRHGNIDRLAFEMEAVEGDALAAGMEHRIGQGRAVSGNHLERLGGAQSMLDVHQQIKERGIDRLYFVGAEIAQDIVDAIELAGNVVTVLPVSGAQTFAGVQTVELERAAPKLDGGVRYRDRRHNQLCSGQGANVEEAPPR